MQYEAVRQLIDDRRRDREAEARNERLAALARRQPTSGGEGRARVPFLGQLLAVRRHALQ